MRSIILILLYLCTKSAFGQKLVDLGHDLSHSTPIYPNPYFNQMTFNLTKMHEGFFPEGFWVAFNSFCSIEHIGTHIDAPYHFSEHGWTLDQIPIERLITQAIVIDVTKKVQNYSNYLVSGEDVDDWIKVNGMLPNNSVILVRTDWSKRYPDQIAYYGSESDQSKATFPGVGPETVTKIHNLKKTDDISIYGFGIDAPSMDNGLSTTFKAHRVAQAENQYIIENMNNLDQLPAKGAIIFVMPMKIKGGSGAPARIIAQLPN